ncbi:MAG TPA: haloacid dehalogenase type II [Bryobacteraceae bacterium]|jgi:2-haloacid dehalogenase|nr:haloacid dehalogenase type II [Bryobacteraceae bacterium]
MTSDRRGFLTRMAISGLALQRLSADTASFRRSIKAVAFDGFPILDPRPVFALVDQLYPERGVELTNVWRTKQFEYTWLRTMSRRYADFRQITDDALVFAAKSIKVDLTPEKHSRLMDAYLRLRCWPDVPEALRSLKNAGIRLAFLSNLTAGMLETGIRNSQLEGLFDHVLSTDRVKAYKPDPRAYQMGVDVLGLKPNQILFAAFAGWDAAGAKSFGYPTFWVNRQNQPAEELGVTPDAIGGNLIDLAGFLVG